MSEIRVRQGAQVDVDGALVSVLRIVAAERGVVARVGVSVGDRSTLESLQVGQSMTVPGWGVLTLENAMLGDGHRHGHAILRRVR